jgi:hypothetical protein
LIFPKGDWFNFFRRNKMAENDGLFGMGGIGLLVVLLFLMGGGNFGFGNNGNLSNEMNRGFDNQNSMANQRETLSAVTAGTAQSVAATNQVYHDIIGYVGDKYSELDRDILTVNAGVQQAIANQNECCCSTKLLMTEQNGQNRYDALVNTNSINATTTAQTQKILDAISQNKIESLQAQVAQLQLAQATSNVVRYPNAWTWNAGPSPFCGCNGCGCGA